MFKFFDNILNVKRNYTKKQKTKRKEEKMKIEKVCSYRGKAPIKDYKNSELNDILTSYAEKQLKIMYNDTLSIPIQVDGRARKNANGLFQYSSNFSTTTPIKIVINKTFMIACLEAWKSGDGQALGSLFDTIRHELVHYHLCKKGEGFKDGHPNFEGELKKFGISSNYNGKVASDYFIYDKYMDKEGEEEYYSHTTKDRSSNLHKRVSIDIIKLA